MANQPHLQQCYKTSVVDIWDIWQQLFFFTNRHTNLKNKTDLYTRANTFPK